ncbi:tyrosine-type recombinase/integrase [Kaistia sp. UC242_56]|uniref:tyrosine-type recombinase/integrase n=1 Tax=Kaistia sp. UC242_56 TaxID=3374625 RepID=UPI0037B5F1EA
MPLSDVACRNAKPLAKAQKLADAGGLYLYVSTAGGKLWRCDYRFVGQRRTASFGAYPHVGLAEARRRRDELKAQIADGIDPGAAKKAAKKNAKLAAGNSFETIAREWFALKLADWVDSYSTRLMSRLEADVFPPLGARPISAIEPPEILDAVRKVEGRGAVELAKRELQTIGQIFRFAIASGRATRDPTRDLVGALKSPGRVKHRRALPIAELPGFLRALDAYDGEPATRLALKLMVLTFVRTSELRAAQWAEFEGLDGAEPLWRIPAERMKMRFEHLVPLAPQAVTALTELREYSGRSAFLFPSPGKEGFMSNNTMLFAMYRMGYHGRATVHGFRGVASTWLNETGYSTDWIERQLAHDERNEVRGAYNSAQYLAGRRAMMAVWSEQISNFAATVDQTQG